MNKIIKIIDTCKTYEQLLIAEETLKKSPYIEDAMRSYYYGMIALKLHQMQEAGYKKQAENRFPCDDEQK